MTRDGASAPGGTTWNALVADDDDDMRMLMASALRRAGFHVYESRDGDELVAFFAASEWPYTLVVSDIGMPTCDGIEVTLAVKKLAPKTPVVLVTAFSNPSRWQAARDAGADEILKKPLNLNTLVQTARALAMRAAS